MPRLAATQSDPPLDASTVSRAQRRLVVSAPAPRPSSLTIRPSYLLGVLWLAAAIIVLLSLVQDLLIFFAPEIGFSDRIYRLDLDTEASLPTWFSAVLLLLSAVSSLFIALHVVQDSRRRAFPWFLLAMIFAVLSLDEIAMIHEWLSAVISGQMDNSGLFYFAWTLPALVICLVGLVCFIPFILGFKGIDRGLLIGSAVVFLLGAIGMEMLGGAQAERAGVESLSYRMLATVEESLEYAGVLLFLWFTLRQIRGSIGRTTVCFK